MAEAGGPILANGPSLIVRNSPIDASMLSQGITIDAGGNSRIFDITGGGNGVIDEVLCARGSRAVGSELPWIGSDKLLSLAA